MTKKDDRDAADEAKRPPPADQNDAMRKFQDFVRRIVRVPKSEVSKDDSTSEAP